MFRLIRSCRSVFIGMTFLAFLILTQLDHAFAVLIDTQSIISEQNLDQFRTNYMNLLAREDVRSTFIQWGINPNEVEAQISALTDQEISQIYKTTGTIPAGSGGAYTVALPIGLVILILFIYALIITGVISIGAYAGVKIKEAQEVEYAKSTPFPAPPRVGPLPSINPNEPWTGKWKVTEGQFSGVYILKQDGAMVVSTNESEQIVDAKVYGAMIWGKIGTGTRSMGRDFKATIADDFLSFRGNVDGRSAFEALKTELKSDLKAPLVNPSEPWTGKWKVTSGRNPGIWSLSQSGDTVVSTPGSDYKLEAKVFGTVIRGKWSTKREAERDFQATIAEDGLSFSGAADYAALRDYFTAKKIE